MTNESVREKTNNLELRLGPTRTGLYNRSLKFRILEEELDYLCNKNKGADQRCSYCTADLRLCFRISILFVFLCSGSNVFAYA